nr:protein enhanced disease resistance 2-like [Tanacetum cinerariifolium]
MCFGYRYCSRFFTDCGYFLINKVAERFIRRESKPEMNHKLMKSAMMKDHAFAEISLCHLLYKMDKLQATGTHNNLLQMSEFHSNYLVWRISAHKLNQGYWKLKKDDETPLR